MSNPIYEIPVTPPSAGDENWMPRSVVPVQPEPVVLPQPPAVEPVPTQPIPVVAPVPLIERDDANKPPLVEPVEVRRRGDLDRLDQRVVGLDQRVVGLDQRVVAPEHREVGRNQRIVMPDLEDIVLDWDPAPTRGDERRRLAAEAEAAASVFSPHSPHATGLRDVTLEEALHEVVRLGASDLHVTIDAPPTIRVNGALQPIAGAAPWTREVINAHLDGILSTRQRDVFAEKLELDFAHTLTEESRFRVNYYQQRGAIGGAFRLIPTEIKQLRELGVPDSVGHFATLPRGLVLVTGPTGSGKSTTLAGLIDLVNRTRSDHIVTVEDPIEFMHKNHRSIVNQREVGEDTHSFANALKHVLRQDPDVILIGELRDLETISVALTAAETGHLVFATLHTQDAAQTVDRVIDVFPPHQQDQVRTQLAATLQGVVCQTLVPKASGKGRVVATEVMIMTPALSNLIREGKTYQILSAMQAGRDLGMHTMDQHLADLVNSGRVTAKAAEAKAHDPEGFRRMLHGVQSPTEATARAMQAGNIDFGDAFSNQAR